MNDDIETEEPFREVYQRLLERRRSLWKKNRHVENAKKRKNDAFVNGTPQGRAKALAKKAAKPVKESAAPRTRTRVEIAHLLTPPAPPALTESAAAPLEVVAYAYARGELALSLPVSPDAAAAPRRRGRPPGSKNKKRQEEEPA